MAAINWKNITANTGAGSASLKQAGSIFGKAFENFQGAIDTREKRLTKRDTEEQLNRLRQITSPEQYEQEIAAFDAGERGDFADPTAINKARAALLPQLQKTAQAETARQLGISDADYARTQSRLVDKRAEEARIRTIESDALVRRLDLEASNREDVNQAAFARTIAQQADVTEGPGQFQQDAAGNIVTAPAAGLDARQQFLQRAEAQGVQEYKNIGDQRKEFNAQADKLKLTGSERAVGLAALEKNYDRSVFSQEEQQRLATFDANINQERDRDIIAEDQITAAKIANLPREKPVSDKERSKGITSLLKTVRKEIPSKTFFGGGDKGGTNLINELVDMTNPQGEFANLEAWEIEQFLMGTIDGENDAWFSFDTYADVDDLKSQLRTYQETRGDGPQARTAAKEAQIVAQSRVNKTNFRTTASKKIARNLSLQERAGGKIDRTKNVRTFNPRATDISIAKLRTEVKSTTTKPITKPVAKNSAPTKRDEFLAKVVANVNAETPEEPLFEVSDTSKRLTAKLVAAGAAAKEKRAAQKIQDEIDRTKRNKIRHNRIYGITE